MIISFLHQFLQSTPVCLSGLRWKHLFIKAHSKNTHLGRLIKGPCSLDSLSPLIENYNNVYNSEISSFYPSYNVKLKFQQYYLPFI